MEQWKPIANYHNYEISNFGSVRNIKTKRLIKKSIHYLGYVRYALFNNSKRTYVYAHRLVANHFLENASNLKEVNHVDGNKQNNNIENLEWTSKQQNTDHAINNGLKSKIIQKSKQVKQYSLNGDLIQVFESSRSAAKILQISQSGISAACNEKIHTYKNFIWKYTTDETQKH